MTVSNPSSTSLGGAGGSAASTAEEQRLQQQLCFNIAHFQRSDFNVDRFVNLARKRATLEQLHADLRAYLRHLQNSMIELINDDYADFVNLSSGLAALRETVDKVSGDIQTNWSQFGSSISDMKKCTDSVQQCIAELSGARSRQTEARDRLAMLQAIQRLNSFLAAVKRQKQPTKATWYSKLVLLLSAVELWSSRRWWSNEAAENAQQKEAIETAKTRCYREARDLVTEAVCEELQQVASAAADDGQNKPRPAKSKLALMLACLQLLEGQDHAVARVISSVVEKRIESAVGDGVGDKKSAGKRPRLDAQLDAAIGGMLELRLHWVDHTRQAQQFTQEVANFLDVCLLNFAISYLDKRFHTVLVPSDARLFHRCFQLVTDKLIRAWSSKREKLQQTLLRTVRDKFNLVVYFKLASQPLLVPLRDQGAPEKFTFRTLLDQQSDSNSGDGVCLCPYSSSLLSTLNVLYSPEVYLPALANKFWEFTLQRLQDYADWAQAVIGHLTSTNAAPAGHPEQTPTSHSLASTTANTTTTKTGSGGRRSASPRTTTRERSPVNASAKSSIANDKFPAVPIWLSLAALCRELQLFDDQLLQFCLSTIWVHLRQLQQNSNDGGGRHIPSAFGQCLSCFSEQLIAKGKAARQAIVELLATELAKSLAAVSDIPRQYRWTKRPPPVGFSSYLGTAFELPQRFREETTTKLGWTEADQQQVLGQATGLAVLEFCDRAEKVLDAVEQTGSSLLRFKQRKAAAAGGQTEEAASETDEAKIRAQLCYDANFVRQRVQEYSEIVDAALLERLERIEQRASATTAQTTNLSASPSPAPTERITTPVVPTPTTAAAE